MSDLIEGFLGKSVDGKKSKLPAQLDFFQSATGLFLGLFICIHLSLLSTILISKDATMKVSYLLEGGLFLKEPQSIVVAFAATFIFIIFIIHAGLGMRKFPINFRQWQVYRTHMKMMKHSDTSLWFIQAVTGFIMFFLGSAHLYMMITKAYEIGPYASADRVWSDFMWPFYLVLLVAVVLHGMVGLYRLSVKWGWFEGKDSKKSRAILIKVRRILLAWFLTIGTLTLITYMKIGYDHRHNVGERYHGAVQFDMGISRKVQG